MMYKKQYVVQELHNTWQDITQYMTNIAQHMTKYRTTYDEISHNTLNNLKQHMTNITRMFLENRHHMSEKYVSC